MKLWHSKPFFDKCEIALAMLVAICSAATASIPEGPKQVPALIAAGLALAVGGVKWRSRTIDTRETAAKASQSAQTEQMWSKTIEKLKGEVEHEKQLAQTEVAVIRERFNGKLKTVMRIIPFISPTLKMIIELELGGHAVVSLPGSVVENSNDAR
jgi:hypothetical protein